MTSTETTKITVAGREFDIPFLPFKKNRVVVNAAMISLNALNKAVGIRNKETGAWIEDPTPLRLTDIDYMYLTVYEAISHVRPEITRTEFDSWGIHLPELQFAVGRIALQTGVLVQSEKAGATGEVKAGL